MEYVEGLGSGAAARLAAWPLESDSDEVKAYGRWAAGEESGTLDWAVLQSLVQEMAEKTKLGDSFGYES